MDKIKFDVSSKTARLIGRENISDFNGAIIELVKNAYDADASNVYIEFDIKFPVVPINLSYQEIKKLFSTDELDFILKCYSQKDDTLLKNDLNVSDEQKLKSLFFSKNKILLLDNGIGMNEEIIKTVWMNIGTNDKEINEYSNKGRLKTGAKGIGRFALEKLSLKTTVYSKKENYPMIFWSIDWKQFDVEPSLNNINADFTILNSDFNKIISDFLDKSFFKSHGLDLNLSTGTLIILQGTTDNWYEKVYDRINRNLQSINPFSSCDKFDVYVNNVLSSKYNFISINNNLSSDDYDYKINAEYNGEDNVTISLHRNEVDLTSKTHITIIKDKEYIFDLKTFWERDAFRSYPYRKEDYDKEITSYYNVQELLSGGSIDEIKKLGPFQMEIFFLKSGNSDYGFVKDIKVNSRKRLLNNFSGIKIYRDNFKVRPYGEDGPMYDWLGLGNRAQRSPAGITHPTGSWRVFTYQLIGSVYISRVQNPFLVDMANREGLSLNESYYLFVDLINSIISKFEYDRQYVYREFGLWLKEQTDPISKSSLIEQEIRNQKEKGKQSETSYTEDDFKEAIYNISEEKRRSLDAQRIMMNFSSVGVTANTFAHEISRVASNLNSRSYQLYKSVERILNKIDFKEPDFLNPLYEIESNKKCDILLDNWLKLIMDSACKKSLTIEKINLTKFFYNLKSEWDGLLEQKEIEFIIPENSNLMINIAKVDLYLIFNNIILNSANYLEKCSKSVDRKINITISEKGINIFIMVHNNGPRLDSKYENTPDIIFEPGETSKSDGTGLGLWICREAVQRNNGEIHVLDNDEGFSLEIKLPKGD